MNGARNGLFFDIETIKQQTFFHDAHIDNGSALWTSWHFTCVSPTHRRNPRGPGTCGRLQSFGAARPLLRLSSGLGPSVLGHTYIPRLQSGGPIGTQLPRKVTQRYPSCIASMPTRCDTTSPAVTVGDVFSNVEFSAPGDAHLCSVGGPDDSHRDCSSFLIMPRARSRGEFMNMVASSLTMTPSGSLPTKRLAQTRRLEPRASRNGKAFASAFPTSLLQVRLPPNSKLVPRWRDKLVPPGGLCVHSTPFVFCSVSWLPSGNTPLNHTCALSWAVHPAQR